MTTGAGCGVGARKWRRVLLRWLSLCGVAAPPLTALVNTIVSTHQPGYSYLRDYVSDLAARGKPDSELLCVWWAVFPLLFAPFVAAVGVGLWHRHFGKVVTILLGLFGVFIGLCGIFPYDPRSPEHTSASRVHLVVSSLSSLTLFPCPFFLWLATRHDGRWRGFRRFSLVVQAGGAVTAALLGFAFINVFLWGGLAERSYWGVYYVWFVGLALKLRRLD
jgi:hypothetical membrane protein